MKNKIKIGIVGLGNLGQACADIVKERKDEFELVAIFSRRAVDGTVPLADIEQYKGKIDVILACMGSSTDAPIMVPQLAKHFNTIDSFDNHGTLKNFIDGIRATQGKNVAIVGTGWDPGLFSILRVYMDAFIYRSTTEMFYGTGVSLGHSNAVREIKGVVDAIQLTIPKQDAVEKVKNNIAVTAHDKQLRVCYVVADTKDHARIEKEIKTMPNYFEPYETEVHFVSAEEFAQKYKGRLDHGGQVIVADEQSQAEFKLTLKSNPYFTACVMVAYSIAAYQMHKEGQTGVFTVADIAPKYLSFDDLLHKI